MITNLINNKEKGQFEIKAYYLYIKILIRRVIPFHNFLKHLILL